MRLKESFCNENCRGEGLQIASFVQEDDSGDESDDGLGYDDDSYWSDSSEDELSYSEEKESD